MKGTEISNKVRAKVYERDSFDGWTCCRYCGSPYDLHIHHYVERSVGGLGIEENLITLCVSCHEKLHKGNLKIKAFCRDYLSNYYKDWNEERLKL